VYVIIMSVQKLKKDVVSRWLGELEANYNVKLDSLCYNIAYEVLARTPHLTKASSVAIASGFCPYAARLVEWVGVKGVYISIKQNLPGKGESIHKILSMAFPEVFYDVFSRESTRLNQLHDKIIQNTRQIASYFFGGGGILQGISNDEINKAEEMIKRAIYGLSSVAVRLGIELSRAKVFTETPLISYSLNLWGVPDVIIEDPEKKRAIVIEWKTGTPEIKERDRVQVYTYLLLELERLGYITPDKSLDEVLRIAITTEPKQTKVYPMIIRPGIRGSHYYSNYPSLPQATRKEVNELVSETRQAITKILLSSYFISILISGLSPAGINYEDAISECGIYLSSSSDGKKVGGLAFNFIPPSLRRFAPSNCPLMEKRSCPWAEYCRIYFAEFEHTNIDTEMWKFRYRTIAKHMRDLALYKALYELSRIYSPEKLVNYIAHGYGFNVAINMHNVSIQDAGKTDVSIEVIEKPSELEIVAKTNRGLYTLFNGRIDVFEFEPDESKKYFDDVLILKRSFRNYEYIDSYEGKTVLNIASSEKRPRTVRQRKPINMYIVEPHVSQLTLMQNVFARVTDVKYDYYKHEISVVITPISWALKHSFILFKRLLERFSAERKLTILVAEANADLTHIELETLGAIHTAMKKLSKDLNLENNSNVQHIIRVIRSNKRRVLHLLSGLISLRYKSVGNEHGV